MKARDLQNIPDVQAAPDSRKLAIDKVGIKSIRHPMRIQERSGGAQHTVAMFNMYVRLREMVEKLEAEEGHIEMAFPYFIEKAAPVSGVKSLMDYEVTFIGEVGG